MIAAQLPEKGSNTENMQYKTGKSCMRLFPEMIYEFFFLSTLKSSLFSLCCNSRTMLALCL